jgi:hypothetical protein
VRFGVFLVHGHRRVHKSESDERACDNARVLQPGNWRKLYRIEVSRRTLRRFFGFPGKFCDVAFAP